jgi:hypothetical protein
MHTLQRSVITTMYMTNMLKPDNFFNVKIAFLLILYLILLNNNLTWINTILLIPEHELMHYLRHVIYNLADLNTSTSNI